MIERNIELNVSKKHLVLRIICFAAAVIIAVASITFGVIQLLHMNEGYHEVDPEKLYDGISPPKNVTLNYYFTGNSNEIRKHLNLVKGDYSTALNNAFKQLDAEKEYDAVVSIAKINNHAGESVWVSEELYGILKDAYAKTQKNEGYSIFAGALYREWNRIIIDDNRLEYDPLFNENERERLAAISAQVNDADNFDLKFDDFARTVTLTLSDKYVSFVEEYEITDAPVIDLNLLHDAYELKMIADELNAKGHTDGYLASEDGVYLALAQHNVGTYYKLLCQGEDGVYAAAAAEMTGGSAYCQFREFPLNEKYRYYVVEIDGKIYGRSPYLTLSGEMSGFLSASYTYSEKASVADVCYANIVLINRKTEQEISAAAEGFENISAAYVLWQDPDNTIHINTAGQSNVFTDFAEKTSGG